jgi:Flp pilus assembly protein CpaB
MDTTFALIAIAIVAALGLLGVVIVDIMLAAQVASAAKPPVKGCTLSTAANASKGRCIQG